MDNIKNTEPRIESKEGKERVLDFNFYIELLSTGQLPDNKRFDEEFFKAYSFVEENSPLHLMFCVFVGALDLAEASEKAAIEREQKKSSDATTETTK